ncbi:hypothetical protein IU500_18605 [Nocardia terpenica]|uniref:hypothetical protein n=1 Tax=Nocardia terpenica TaxID=455432 RepID=UPI00189464C7|nr:hypothetical protein [Nocardia terpenica]MBF6063498.1 hypothetical protein [Nocardia terpenica]MBF6106054.1 hypothetical protein [Nocardia terpenica]MBF6113361.1 hypothetical protein [Nocardia terpenica]MBF6119795.1 hypothetical protein [Nocardia terpenica]MBF6152206.1 hypothetical protein [Nocardia terpenica]
MTQPEPAPDAVTVRQWQATLLQQIQILSSEHARVSSQGTTGYDGTDNPDRQSQMRAYGGEVSAMLAEIEDRARSTGLHPRVIADVRAAGAAAGAAAAGTRPTPQTAASPGTETVAARPAAATGAADPRAGDVRQISLDLMTLDVWQLEDMALHAAERQARWGRGGGMFGHDPVAEADFARNMELRHERVATFARAVGLSAGEAEFLWGDTGFAAQMRSMRAARLKAAARDELEFGWRAHAQPSPDSPTPATIPTDPQTGSPVLAGEAVLPPSPQEFIDRARLTLAGTSALPAHQHPAETAVDTTLGYTGQSWDPATAIETPQPSRSPDLGTEP